MDPLKWLRRGGMPESHPERKTEEVSGCHLSRAPQRLREGKLEEGESIT